MSSSCTNIKNELIACLKFSKCMVEYEKTFHECLKSNDEEEIGECLKIKKSFFECKRGQLDMRRRFRGNTARYGE